MTKRILSNRLFAALAALGALLSFASVAAAAVQPEKGGYWFPRDVSLNGHRIDWLINITMVFVVILFVIMCIWMAMACVKHGRGHVADYDHGDAKKSVTFALCLSALIFFVVDGNLFYNSVKDLDEAFWNFDDAAAHPEVVKVEVNARQWAWDFRLAGPDGKFATADDVVTLNDLRIPKDRPILLQIGAVDVIHSFYVPNMRQKIDAVPGNINLMWFQAKETGEFDIACAQHCGTNHYLMKGKLTILDSAGFDAWAAQASRVSQLDYDEKDMSSHWGWDWMEKTK